MWGEKETEKKKSEEKTQSYLHDGVTGGELRSVAAVGIVLVVVFAAATAARHGHAAAGHSLMRKK